MIAGGPKVPLSAEQQAASDVIVKDHDSDHIVTGKAGAGKTTTIQDIRDRVPLIVCATTAVAALNAGGCTIDTLFSLDRANWRIFNERSLMNNMQKVPRRIVIDECSMIGAKMAELVFDAARKYDKQLILVGDFAQAAPVKEDPAVETPLFMRSNLINLKECHRQNGGVYLEALNDIRVGDVTTSARDVFRSRICDLPAEHDEMTMRIFATRALVDSRNNQMLATIKSVSVTCIAEYMDARDPYLKEKYPLKPEAALRALEQSPMAYGKSFKIGARIMMTLNVYNDPDSNGDRSLRWVNGDLGRIVDMLDSKGESLSGRKAVLGQTLKPDRFIVKLDRTSKDITVGIVDMPIYGVGKEPVAYISGFPMTLGWAVTTHKCQGLTLPRAYIDVRSITHHPLESRHGLAYVALSRVRNLEDLYLSGWEDSAVHCSPAMKKFVQP